MKNTILILIETERGQRQLRICSTLKGDGWFLANMRCRSDPTHKLVYRLRKRPVRATGTAT